MSSVLQRLILIATCLLSGMLTTVLMAQIRPAGRPLAKSGAQDNDWTWPLTLQVYPAHSGDPVELVRITKDGNEVVPGTYRMPQIAGDGSQDVAAVDEWLRDTSFTLKSQTLKNIVSVGIAVVFPVQDTGVECFYITDCKSAPSAWCDAHPHWCDGGCPALFRRTLHWGLIPGPTASGLEARYARARAEGENWRDLLQGEAPLRLVPGQEITLSLDGRVDGFGAITDPRHGVSDTMNGIVGNEGIDEAKDTDPCRDRADSKTGCAFAEVPKFNIGIDVVYFEDGTIWGNYGYGYALPSPDGIFRRVDTHNFPGIVTPASAPN